MTKWRMTRRQIGTPCHPASKLFLFFTVDEHDYQRAILVVKLWFVEKFAQVCWRVETRICIRLCDPSERDKACRWICYHYSSRRRCAYFGCGSRCMKVQHAISDEQLRFLPYIQLYRTLLDRLQRFLARPSPELLQKLAFKHMWSSNPRQI